MPELRDWEKLMNDYNTAILSSNQPVVSASKNKWFGYPGATSDEISQLENRLKVILPPSYREFLTFTNGWADCLTYYIGHVNNTDEIDWFALREPDWCSIWQNSTIRTDIVTFNPKHVPATPQISDTYDGAVLLLNPNVIDQNGEWEAWFLANWIVEEPRRFSSFWELMQNMYEEFVDLIHNT